VARLRRWYLEDLRASKDERANRKKDWRMWSGDQYEQEARDRARAENRPLLTLNYVLPTICAIEGEERSNRQQIKVYGFDDADDDKGAYAFNLLIRGIMNENNGEYSVSAAFKHASVCGVGWLHPDVDYWADPEGQICVRHVDEDEIVNDCMDRSPDASESRRLTRMRWLGDDVIEAMFPGSLDKMQGYAEANSNGDDIPTREGDGRGYRDIFSEPSKDDTKVYDCQRKEWLVLEHWWYEIVPGFVARNNDSGELEELTIDEGHAIQKQEQEAQANWPMERLSAALTGQPIPPAACSNADDGTAYQAILSKRSRAVA
jgi:hypothetical protein